MRILYVVAEHPSLTETFVSREMQALRGHGFEVGRFVLRRGRAAATDGLSTEAGGAAEAVDFAPPCWSASWLLDLLATAWRSPRPSWQALRGLARAGGGRLPAWFKAWRRLGVAAGLAAVVRRRRIDHLHAQFAFVTADLARAVARLTGVSFSVGTHAWDIFGQPPAAVRRHLEGAVFLTVCTEMGRRHLRELLPTWPEDRLLLVRHGLASGPEPTADAAGQMIVAIGRLVYKKGFCDLVDACHILRHGGENFDCTIIGDGDLRRPLQAMVDQLELTDQVHLTGALPHAEAMAKLRQAAVFVLPSIQAADGDRDGLPNVILEAMAAGLPVVSTTAGAAGEAVVDGKTGYLVPPGEPQTLADRLQQLLGQAERRRQMGAAGRRLLLEQFNPERTVAPLADRLRQLPGSAIAKTKTH